MRTVSRTGSFDATRATLSLDDQILSSVRIISGEASGGNQRSFPGNVALDARGGQGLGVDPMLALSIGRQLGMTRAAVGGAVKDDPVDLFEMPESRLRLCNLGGNVVARHAA